MSNDIRAIYTDPAIGLLVTAWPASAAAGGWLVRFYRRNTRRCLLNQTARWLPSGCWAVVGRWDPARHRLIPPAALAAVEAWLQCRAVVEVAS